MAMTFTASDLDNLKAALLSGVLRVRIGDRDVQYRSLDELERTIKKVEAYLAGSSAANTKNIKASYSKGE